MKTLSFFGLNNTNFAATDISVIHQTPLWSTLGGIDDNHSGRKLNGYLLITSGKCIYEWEGGSAELGHGDLIYLPKGAKRAVTVIEKPFSFYRISFVLKDASDTEEFIFSKTPYVAARSTGQKLFDLCERLRVSTLSYANKLGSTALLFELFASINKLEPQTEKSRVTPAVEYIQKHYTEPLDIDTLCELCYLSKPYFFKLFKKETGTTPIIMRNDLRIDRAKSLLFDEECQISEISAMLGFESIYYFSRSFKNAVGISPQEYRKKKSKPI
jgi:AraC-like DNA-binding protein